MEEEILDQLEIEKKAQKKAIEKAEQSETQTVRSAVRRRATVKDKTE